MEPSNLALIKRWSRWLGAWTALSLPGLFLSIFVWGPGRTVGVAATVAIPTLLILTVTSEDARRTVGACTKSECAGWISRVTAFAVSFVVLLSVVAVIIPVAALLLLGLAGATTPPCMDQWRRLLVRPSPSSRNPRVGDFQVSDRPVTWTALNPPESAREMSMSQLCSAWRRSYWTLHDTADPLVRLSVVVQRQRLLDELEARDTAGLQAWLDSGARCSTGLERFLADVGGSDGDDGNCSAAA